MTIAIAASTIVQLAFEAMEMSPPASFGDDSDQAQSAALHYDTALAICIEAQDWSFASTLAELSPVSGATPIDPDLPHAYALPADCRMLRDVGPAGTSWRSDAGLLRADHAVPILIRYSRNITDEALLPAAFRLAVALQLALLMAPRFVQVQGKVDRIEARLSQAMVTAARADARTASSAGWSQTAGDGDWASEARQ